MVSAFAALASLVMPVTWAQGFAMQSLKKDAYMVIVKMANVFVSKDGSVIAVTRRAALINAQIVVSVLNHLKILPNASA